VAALLVRGMFDLARRRFSPAAAHRGRQSICSGKRDTHPDLCSGRGRAMSDVPQETISLAAEVEVLRLVVVEKVRRLPRD